ncbi:GNAT family N-acetyltransferase [Streptomyces hyaluromycini]|uniref:GNAT family N-acetyltransferase n=1 Tax=Streptomyces hyaluromycini TaxID=1377993 RepID=A0ABV1WTT2_9ACTN
MVLPTAAFAPATAPAILQRNIDHGLVGGPSVGAEPARCSGRRVTCSVYVVPAERDGGLGGRLIDAVLDRARELGLERVTVHSSPRAVPACSRHGFESSPRLLHAHVARTTSYP